MAATDPLVPQAQALVRAFYVRFHGLPRVTASPKELTHATELLVEHGEAKTHFLLAYTQQVAPETAYCPQTFMGILHYLPQAHAAYDARATQHTTRQAVAPMRTWHECSLVGWQQAMEQPRATLPRAALAVRKDAQRSSLVAAGTLALTLESAVRVAVDEALEAQARLLTFDAWRQTQEDA